MKKGLIVFGMLMGLFLSSTVLATPGIPLPVPPAIGIDIGRSISGIIAGIMNLCGDGESKAQLIAVQEENNKKASGSGGSTDKTDTSSGTMSMGSAGASEFSGSAFDYISTNLLNKENVIQYKPVQTALSSAGKDRAKVRQAVLDLFFADPTKEEQKTTEYMKKIRSQRDGYAQEAAGRHITLGYRVKNKIQNDLSVISSASLTGDGEIGAIAVDAHTLEQMVKMELVDLALQIEMMEADAIHFLMYQPVTLMSETKPSSSSNS